MHSHLDLSRAQAAPAEVVKPRRGSELGQALVGLFDRLGIAVEERDGRWVALGIQLADRALPAPAEVKSCLRRNRKASFGVLKKKT